MNLHEIINMGGYGIYIWPAYFFTLGVFAVNIGLVVHETRRAKKILSHYFKRHYES